MLRKKGNTYSEINKALSVKIPKATLSYWCKGVTLSVAAQKRIALLSAKNLERGRGRALEHKRLRRAEFVDNIKRDNRPVVDLMQSNMEAKKAVLAVLYLAEGSKTNRASIMFGNSNPTTVKLFVELLRACFYIDESKFRATVQCRADQDPVALRKFWSKTIKIPESSFYKPHIDQRTNGKPTRKKDYKGVCRIDYFSSKLDFELKCIAGLIESLKLN